MSRSWVPFSAAALVTGAVAVMLGALLMPMGGEGSASTFRQIELHEGRWLMVSVMFGIASVGILVGLPSMLLLFQRRGRNFGFAGVGLMVMASAGLAGFGMILVFFQTLVTHEAIRPGPAFEASTDAKRFSVMLLGWAASYYLAELFLAIAVLRARSVPRWIPVLLLLHVVSFPVQQIAADLPPLTILLSAIGLSGLAICANTEADRLSGLGR